MSDGLSISNGIIIPEHEIEITTSRGGGPGGQHVNKTSTRITVRWNLFASHAISDEQKARIAEKLAASITTEGDIIVHNNSSRSQDHNKKEALAQLAHKISKALHVPKKRMKTRVSQAAKEKRLQSKKLHSEAKRMRSKKFD